MTKRKEYEMVENFFLHPGEFSFSQDILRCDFEPAIACRHCPMKTKPNRGQYRCKLTRKRVRLTDACPFAGCQNLTVAQALKVLHQDQKPIWDMTAKKEVPGLLLKRAQEVAIIGLRALKRLGLDVDLNMNHF